MKKIYKKLLYTIAIIFVILHILGKMGIGVESWFFNAIAVAVFILPVCILLYLLSKDEEISKRARFISTFFFYFILVAYVAGGVAEYMETQGLFP